jgi:hypothetical protein
MKLFSLCACLLFAGALLFIFSSATKKPTVDGHKPVATFWPGAKVTNNTDWAVNVSIGYAGLNANKEAVIESQATHTFPKSSNLISSVQVYEIQDRDRIRNRVLIVNNQDGSKIGGLGCGNNCNFTISQYFKRTYDADSIYMVKIAKN